MSTISKKEKNTFKILFFIAVFGLVAVSILYLATKGQKSTSLAELEALETQLQNSNEDKNILLTILEADNLLISQTNSQKALELYQESYDKADEQLQKIISGRIEYTKQIIASNKDDEVAKINLRSQIANQKKVIDSLSNYSDSLQQNSQAGKAIQLKQIDSLQLKISKQEQALARKDAKQVISFTNENGNLIHYLGEVKNGKANGGGIGIWNTGSIYKGEWKNNNRHGIGEFKWADGQIYEGEFNNDIRSGEGTYYWPTGEKYVGEFANNRMNGQGILYDPDGNKEYEGQWKNDKPKQ